MHLLNMSHCILYFRKYFKYLDNTYLLSQQIICRWNRPDSLPFNKEDCINFKNILNTITNKQFKVLICMQQQHYKYKQTHLMCIKHQHFKFRK